MVRRLVPAWRQREIGGVEYLPGGYSNRNFRLEMDGARYVLRLVERGAPRPGERRYLAIPAAPDVVAYDDRRGHMLTRWIDGCVIADAPPTVEEAGAYLAGLHRQIPAGARRYDYAAEVSAMLERGGRGADDPVAARFRRLAWMPERLAGCHNDLNPWNVIRAAAGGFRTLDWEFAGDNDPLFDLAGLCFGLGWGIDETADCLAAYRAEGAPVAATLARLHDTLLAFRIREYAWAVAQIAAGNDRPEIREQAEANLRAVTRER